MDAKVAVRPANEGDKGAIFILYRELDDAYRHDISDDAVRRDKCWQEVFHDRRQHILVAVKETTVVATLTLIVVPNLGHQGQPWAAVTNVVVDVNHRGQGIGRLLLAEAGRIAREYNCYKIVLSSNVVRRDAHEFYRRLGWRQSHIGFSLALD